jgi:hypothetical protein
MLFKPFIKEPDSEQSRKLTVLDLHRFDRLEPGLKALGVDLRLNVRKDLTPRGLQLFLLPNIGIDRRRIFRRGDNGNHRTSNVINTKHWFIHNVIHRVQNYI